MYDKRGEVTGEFGMDLKEKYGADFEAMKRSDFRDELASLAVENEGGDVQMRWEMGVVGLDCEEGVVTLEDGTTAKADVVIGMLLVPITPYAT